MVRVGVVAAAVAGGLVVGSVVVARVEGRLVVGFVSGLAVQRREEGAARRVFLASGRAISNAAVAVAVSVAAAAAADGSGEIEVKHVKGGGGRRRQAGFRDDGAELELGGAAVQLDGDAGGHCRVHNRLSQSRKNESKQQR
mmetsp:Transcript_30093/g.63390  ORF Transcript_30093/g.63390 Transcript_30093/m.63390 type:complete len:141 (+) Transcript_30093:1127-1549(+)